MKQTRRKKIEGTPLSDVQVFVAAADAQTFTAAAIRLGVPASTISRALTRLENRLGVTLAQRNVRGFVLTDVGKGYLAICRKALRVIHEGEEWIEAQKGHPSGSLRVSCPLTFGRDILAPLLGEFLNRYPGLKIEFDTYASGSDHNPADDVDIFFRVLRPKDSARRMRSYPGHALGLFASSAYVRQRGQPLSPSELTKHSCVGHGTWELSRNKRTQSVQPEFLVDIIDPQVTLTLLLSNLGIGVLPLWLAHCAEHKEHLVEMLPDWKLNPLVMCALFFGSSKQIPKAQVLLDFLGEYIGTKRDPRVRGNWSRDLFPGPVPRDESQ